jgi:hypothetical protein
MALEAKLQKEKKRREGGWADAKDLAVLLYITALFSIFSAHI